MESTVTTSITVSTATVVAATTLAAERKEAAIRESEYLIALEELKKNIAFSNKMKEEGWTNL